MTYTTIEKSYNIHTFEMNQCVNVVIFTLNCVTVLKQGFFIFALNSFL